MTARPRSQTRTVPLVGERISGSHVRVWLVLVAAAVVIGSAGYALIAGWPLDDALYQTVITLTTVGFREVHELDGSGRVWTMLVSVAGVGIIFGSIGIVAEYLIGEVASGRREARKVQQSVDALRDHFILCGYGRVGSTVARELEHAGQKVVVIDTNEESRGHARAEGHLVIEGDATDDATLVRAGVTHAKGLVATVDSDAQNVFVVLSARTLNPKLFIVGRANFETSEAKLVQAGANRVVSPYNLAGRRMAELAIRPRVTDYLDAALSHGELAFSMEEVEVAAGGFLDGKAVGDLRAEGIFVLAVFQGERRHIANPPDSRTLAPGESIVLSGPAEALRSLRERA